MKKFLILFLIGIGGYVFYLFNYPSLIVSSVEQTPVERSAQSVFLDIGQNTSIKDDNQVILDAYNQHISRIQVHSSGIVERILNDDNEGRRHQKFIIRLATNQTLLIAHNIDLAPRIDTLCVGDKVSFYGEYAWNAKGGVIHWTHHDPRGYHISGWLKHNGITYQ